MKRCRWLIKLAVGILWTVICEFSLFLSCRPTTHSQHVHPSSVNIHNSLALTLPHPGAPHLWLTAEIQQPNLTASFIHSFINNYHFTPPVWCHPVWFCSTMCHRYSLLLIISLTGSVPWLGVLPHQVLFHWSSFRAGSEIFASVRKNASYKSGVSKYRNSSVSRL